MKTQKIYEVGFWHTEHGSAFIAATSEEEAEKLLDEHLEYCGVEGLDYECNSRDYGAQDAEELELPLTYDSRKKEIPAEDLKFMRE